MALCKNEECSNEFKPKHKRHYFCRDICKYRHHNKTEKHLEGMRRFNKSAKGKVRTRKYLNSEKGKKYHSDKAKRFRRKYPERIRAINLANMLLPDKPCSINRCEKAGHKHHDDYSKPLDVIYLCVKHHMELHHRNTVTS
ncbi:MAG: hypothetical protein V3U54_09915 [Thermodesulfobacteriota bacterium]